MKIVSYDPSKARMTIWRGGSVPVFTYLDSREIEVIGSWENPISLRCEYCDDHSHLTVECPGLRHSNPIAEAFKAKHFPPPKLVCSACGQPSHPGRKMFCPNDTILCGDCVAGGTPLLAPKVEPLTAADCCAWETACEEGVD